METNKDNKQDTVQDEPGFVFKAYKIFNNDWTCNGFQYEIGKTYIHDGKIELCSSGFHACKNLHDCFKHYPCVPWNKIAEVDLVGHVLGHDGDKQVTDKIKIVKEINFEDIGKIIKNNISDGVNYSKGVNDSYGILNSFGVDHGLFVSNKKKTCIIFNKKTTEARFEEIKSKLDSCLNGWHPEFNNLKSLYLKSGSNWSKTPIPFAKEVQKKEAWESMPKAAIYYLKSLPEFNQKIFTEITGVE